MKTLMMLLILTGFSLSSFAGGKLQRIGGNFTVTEINKLAAGDFEVVFKAETDSDKYNKLKLKTDHINVAVEQGKTIKLSAEVERVEGDFVWVRQMVIFVPSPQGSIPIWLLSKAEGKPNFKREKYLKMHAPNSDYTVF